MKVFGARERRVAPALFLALLVLSTRPAEASFILDSLRNAQYDFWQTSDGLPYHDVDSLAQTPDGYIWLGMIGSSNSLVRFNGFEFLPATGLAGKVGNAPTCLAVGKKRKAMDLQGIRYRLLDAVAGRKGSLH